MSRRRTVIIFKSESESDDRYAEELLSNGFDPIFVPTLSFGFKNLDKLHAKLLVPDHFAGVIFTSPRCVEAVCEALQLSELHGGWKLLHNYAVGEVTHNLALSSLDQLFTHGKQTGNARNLADFIVDTFDGSRELPLLLPCGNLRTDMLLSTLVDHGFKVDACEVYETTCHPALAENMERALKADNIEYFAFFSPSGVNYVHEYCKSHNVSMDNWKLVAIGPSTRIAIEDRGLKVFQTAARPSVEYLIKVLLNPSEGRAKPTGELKEAE